jgi:hypothetical protein
MHFRVQMKADWAQSDPLPKEVGPEQQDSFGPSYTGSANPSTSVSLVVSLRPAWIHQILAHADFLFQAMDIYQIIRCGFSDQRGQICG